MLSADHIRSLPGDPECIEALAWLAESCKGYPPGLYTPPLKATDKQESPPRFLALTCRIRRGRENGQTKIGRIEWQRETERGTCDATDAPRLAESLARNVFTTAHAGSFIVTSGQRRHVLDVFLEYLGPSLLTMGYTLQPCIRPEGIAFIIVRKGKRSWRLVYFDVMFGISVSIGLDFAHPITDGSSHQERLTQSVYTATSAVLTWLASTFGVAGRLTAGMTALACARRHLPPDLLKWRPTALLLAMERAGNGYRGGIAYGRRYRGPTWRIDVNRQYTAALCAPLPAEARFASYQSGLDPPDGVFMCRVRLSGGIPYPYGVWHGPAAGFAYETRSSGEFVCVLHTSEFDGLRRAGAAITPSWGYAFKRTFSLAGYVRALQSVLDTYGRDSGPAQLAKALGNYVYGKFGQRPGRQEVMYAASKPGDGWHPFFDTDGTDWQDVWERQSVRYTSFQHADIAATVTGAARSQTLTQWAALIAAGYRVVRCHTDSLTVDKEPGQDIHLSDTIIGGWRLEDQNPDSIIIGPNAFFDAQGAHIAGVSEPTYEMVDTLYDGSVVTVTQDVNFPRRGWRRGKSSRAIELRAGAG